MKNDFIRLYNEMFDIEKKFHCSTVDTSGIIMVCESKMIYDVPEFIKWHESIIYELSTIINNQYIKDKMEYIKVDFKGFTDISDFNRIKGIMQVIYDRIDDFYLRGEEKMSNIFKSLENDIISVYDNDNLIAKKINASVQKDKIFISNANIKIEEGFIIKRELSNGIIENYRVLDKGYYEGFENIIPPHYECEVKKITNLTNSTKNSINETTINAEKVYINSTDNSNNYVNDIVVFDKMLEAYKQSGNNDQKIIELITEMKKCNNKDDFKSKFSSFMQVAANCMTVFAPFLPTLVQLV